MTRKSDLTKQKLYRIALDMISRVGFEATTMRAIATEAEVAPGAIYYHFDSKESLVQEYYRQSHADHVKAIGDFLSREKSFAERLRKTVATKIEVAEPHKDMARALFRVAANPASQLSPFSEDSKALRFEALELMKSVVEGSEDKFNADVKELLPSYLWLYEMGVILFWIYDTSKGSAKTFELIDKTVPLIASANDMLQSPLAAPFRKKALSILKSFAPQL